MYKNALNGATVRLFKGISLYTQNVKKLDVKAVPADLSNGSRIGGKLLAGSTKTGGEDLAAPYLPKKWV